MGWASLVLDGHLPLGAFLDSGSITHNFVSVCVCAVRQQVAKRYSGAASHKRWKARLK